jgi:hypothetical protein
VEKNKVKVKVNVGDEADHCIQEQTKTAVNSGYIFSDFFSPLLNGTKFESGTRHCHGPVLPHVFFVWTRLRVSRN